MKLNDIPKLMPVPFGVSGPRTELLQSSPAGDRKASYKDGFPPITMLLKSAGGLPPDGGNMNQILFELASGQRWSNAGAGYKFNATFSDAVGGYPKGAQLLSNDGTKVYVSTKDDNKTDFNTSPGPDWVTLGDYIGLGDYATKTEVNSKLAKDQNGADIPDKPKFIENLGLPEKYQPKGDYQPTGNYADGNTFKKNVDNASVTSPAGKYSLIIDDNGKVFTWDGVNAGLSFSSNGVLEVGYVPYARVTGAPAHLGVGQSWNNMTSSRSVGVTYTNDTGKPIQLCVYYGITGVGDWGASLIVNGIETGGSNGGFNCIIPAGTAYRLDVSGTARLSRWLELR